MDIALYKKAQTIQEELEYYRKHKQELIESGVLNGGRVLYQFNSSRSGIELDSKILGDFLKDYCYDLESHIQELEKEFNEL